MKKWSFLFIIFLVTCFFLSSILFVEADSGWDYDYGGSYDIGGDYDVGGYDSGSYSSRDSYSHDSGYDDGSSFSSSGGGGEPLTFSIGTIATLAIIGYMVFGNKKKGKKKAYIPEDNNSVEDGIIKREIERKVHEEVEILDNNYDSVIQKFLPDHTEESLLKELFDVFVTIQNAWMNFDYDTLEKNCSQVLFEAYRSDLEALKEDHGKNIMKEFELISSNIRSIEERNHKVYVKMYLFVSFYDYVVDLDSKSILRGNMDAPVRIPYDLEFIMDLEGITTCPSCGAELTSNECVFCHTVVPKKKESFVLNKKGVIRN